MGMSYGTWIMIQGKRSWLGCVSVTESGVDYPNDILEVREDFLDCQYERREGVVNGGIEKMTAGVEENDKKWIIKWFELLSKNDIS